MKKSMSHYLSATALAAAVVLAAAASAQAEPVVCTHKPGMLAFLLGGTTTQCVAYQGDIMVKQGAAYDGPAKIAPQPTYAPSTLAADYPYVHGKYQAEPAAKAAPARPRVVKRKTVKRQVVNVKNDLPPGKGKPQIVKAQAEVRIYGPDRMDIRLYRR